LVLHFNDSQISGVLEIRNAGSGRVYGRWQLDEPGRFAIEFTHSVNRSPVRETFQIENGMLALESVRFYAFGAGIQSDLEEGQTLSQDGDAMILFGFDFSLKKLNLIVGTGHLLLINDKTVSLEELCGRNTQITIQYR